MRVHYTWGACNYYQDLTWFTEEENYCFCENTIFIHYPFWQMDYFFSIPEFSNNLPFFFFFFTDYFCSLKGSHKTQTICFFINILKIFCMNLVKSLHKVSYNNCTLVKTGSRTMWYWKRINPRKTRGKKITVCIDDKFRTYMKLALKSWS